MANECPATKRAMELMYMPMPDLPPLATEFRRHLGSQVGMCMEVCITAYAVYAQMVEGVECTDDLYRVRLDHAEWFRERMGADVS